jgi:hypothetical protein
MRTIVFNRGNIVPDGQNNQLVYSFPNSVRFKDSYIAVSQVNMYYSWLNISAAIGNNQFSYTFWDGNPGGPPITFQRYDMVVPDGLYEISALNSFLQAQMILNGTYLIDGNLQNVYPLEIQINPTAYAVQINTYSFPNPTEVLGLPAVPSPPVAIPATMTAPANWVGGFTGLVPNVPTQHFNAQLILPATMSSLMGFVAGFTTNQYLDRFVSASPLAVPFTFGTVVVAPNISRGAIDTNAATSTGVISYLSSTAPDVNPNSSVYLNVSNIDNVYASPTGIIYSVTPKVSIGGQIAEQPPQFAWNKLIEGTYNQLRLTFLGINLQPVRILDPNMTIIMVIKDRNEL